MTHAVQPKRMPTSVEAVLLPFLNMLVAFFLSGLVIWALGEDPFAALDFMVGGAFGYEEATGYTLYYATNFIFTGLAVAVAFHAGHFNIGGEGQAMMGGLGLTLAVFWLSDFGPFFTIVGGVVGAVLFGGLWVLVPAWLQAKRGSHIVITTIMFNFIAASLLSYLLVGPLQRPGGQMPESSDFPDAARLPSMSEMLEGVGVEFEPSPLNLSFIIALLVAFAIWFLLARSKLGYEIRVVGKNQDAARYAGISVARITIIALLISGGLAGMMGLNELMGEQQRLLGGFTLGYGFVGIAVAFMGRNHPFGIVLAAVLFGALYQGGAELAFEMPKITRDFIGMIQGLVILFAGAMPFFLKRPVNALYSAVLARAVR